MNFLASPEIVTAMSFAGTLTFDPTRDTLRTAEGGEFKFTPPCGEALPSKGFEAGREVFDVVKNQVADEGRTIVIDENSQRLQLLKPFKAWDGQDMKDMVSIGFVLL